MERPTGVTVLAVFNFLGALLMIGCGVLFMVGMGLLGAAAGAGAHEAGAGAAGPMALLAGMGAIAGVIFLVLAVIPLLVGIGLWKLKNWARIVSIVLAGLGGLGALLGLLGAFTHFAIGVIIWQLIWLAIYVLIITYLMKPHVKQAFGA